MYIVKCKNAGKIGTEQMYEHEWNNGRESYSELNPYETAMLNDF